MKKIIIVFALIFSIIICIPSCNNKENYDETFNTINALSEKDYTFYTIDIEVKSNDGSLSLKENYLVTSVNGTRTVKYHIERFNQFVVDGEDIYVPNEYVTVTEGTLTSNESESEKYAFPSFNFSSNSVKVNSLVNSGTYSQLNANITSLEGLMGINVDASNPTIEVYYNNDQINSVEISYVNGSGNVTTLTYTIQ
jgi:hypothetical protein